MVIFESDRGSTAGAVEREKIGSVLPSDCFTLSQLSIGATVQFESISLEDAQEEMKEFYGFFE